MAATVTENLVRATRDRRAQAAAGAVVVSAAAVAGKLGIDRLTGDDGPSRAYRLKHGESVKDGVRRIAHGRADDAVERLDSAANGDLGAGIHEARKDLKKLRSLLRLARDGLGDATYSRENRRFRDAGRRLSDARDAEVKLETLAALENRFEDALPDRAADGLRERLEGDRADELDEARGQLDAAAIEIATGRERIGDWPLTGSGWSLLEPGIRRSYRRSRKRMARVREEPSSECVHEWRKRTKDHWYHLRLISGADREALGAEADQVHELSGLLGDHHDLEVLADRIRSDPAAFQDRHDQAALLLAIAKRQDELLVEGLALGERLYEEKPGAFAERIEKRWKAWRN
jgi:CHAD domain-containing protein